MVSDTFICVGFDDYGGQETSQPMTREAAENLAQEWSCTKGWLCLVHRSDD